MIEINDKFKQAYDLISQTGDCVFVTGKAGTGKTTFLKYYMENTHKKTVVLAPTGIAALNARGSTIHAFFHFKTDVTLAKVKAKRSYDESLYNKVETIIIDEVSMLRCDLLDCVDKFLRSARGRTREPFGGVQMVFIGDLQQLPPVVKKEEEHIFNTVYETPYFVSAKSLKNGVLHTVELDVIYRQQDPKFISLLSSVRSGCVGKDELAILNSKVTTSLGEDPMSVYLTTTNKKAMQINHQFLSRIDEESSVFFAETENIDVNSKIFPAEMELELKKGAQVMLLNNDFQNRWVNGSIGIIEEIRENMESDKVEIWVKFSSGKTQKVDPYKWELFDYSWNPTLQQIETKSAGFFKQYPLKLAWAVTIHKSQGKTFDNVVIDMGFGSFAPGQLYVALSRCTSFDGVSLSRPITKRDIMTAKIEMPPSQGVLI